MLGAHSAEIPGSSSLDRLTATAGAGKDLTIYRIDNLEGHDVGVRKDALFGTILIGCTPFDKNHGIRCHEFSKYNLFTKRRNDRAAAWQIGRPV